MMWWIFFESTGIFLQFPDSINYVVAAHSAPQLPPAAGSSEKFQVCIIIENKFKVFLTPVAKKTHKTQAKNSRKKTQPQGGNLLWSRKTEEKNSILNLFLWKLNFLRGQTFYAISDAKYMYIQNQYITIENLNFVLEN